MSEAFRPSWSVRTNPLLSAGRRPSPAGTCRSRAVARRPVPGGPRRRAPRALTYAPCSAHQSTHRPARRPPAAGKRPAAEGGRSYGRNVRGVPRPCAREDEAGPGSTRPDRYPPERRNPPSGRSCPRLPAAGPGLCPGCDPNFPPQPRIATLRAGNKSGRPVRRAACKVGTQRHDRAEPRVDRRAEPAVLPDLPRRRTHPRPRHARRLRPPRPAARACRDPDPARPRRPGRPR